MFGGMVCADQESVALPVSRLGFEAPEPNGQWDGATSEERGDMETSNSPSQEDQEGTPGFGPLEVEPWCPPTRTWEDSGSATGLLVSFTSADCARRVQVGVTVRERALETRPD